MRSSAGMKFPIVVTTLALMRALMAVVIGIDVHSQLEVMCVVCTTDGDTNMISRDDNSKEALHT